MWYVKMYMNTGFNLINVPDSPSLLEQKTSKKFGVIDCLQRYFLPSITIRATEDQVIHGDFLKLYDDEDDSKYAYYVINSYTMTSGDTVTLDVTMEPLLTCGGIDNIDIVDGMTSRYHLAAGEEIPTEKDPYLIPKKIYVSPVAWYANGAGINNNKLIVRASVSRGVLNYIANRATNYDSLLQPAVNLDVTYDQSTQTIEEYTGMFCATPILSDNIKSDTDDLAEITVKNYRGAKDSSGMFVADLSDGTYYTFYDDDDKYELSNAVEKLVKYGRPDVILDAYFVPSTFEEQMFHESAIDIKNAINKYVNDDVTMCQFNPQAYKILPDLGSVTPDDIHNKRAYFGDHFAYTFLSPDNNQSVTVNPEEFYDPSKDYVIPQGSTAETDDLVPNVLMSYDLRPGGNMTFKIMPYQKFLFGVPNPNGMSPHVLSTDTWDTASLTVSAVEGGYLKAKNYAMSSYNKDNAVEMDIQNKINNKTRGLRFLNPFNHISSVVQSAYNYAGGEMLTGKATGYEQLQSIGRSAAGGNEYAKQRYDRMLEREKEDMEFATSMVPKVQVISKNGGSSIMAGQGLIVFRNYVSIEDLQRFDKILNKYGCKCTAELKKSMLTNRPLFNYIETQGVSIKCSTVPKSVRDELANAFNTGLRIWHVKDVNVNAWNDPVEEES